MSGKGFASDIYPEYVVLGLLYGGEMHGYDLFQCIEAEMKYIWKLSQPQVYNLLRRMEKQGNISGILQEQSGKPDKKVYQLTDCGKEHFYSWLFTPSGSSIRAFRVDYLTKIYFLQRSFPTELSVHIQNQLDLLKSDLSSMHELMTNLEEIPDHGINQMAIDLRIRHLKILIDWLGTNHEMITQYKGVKR
ncbi:MAG: PadR family transcriptional regulator [Anaerolineales bacterium]|nr:PadR family transcriptional regulator [Anaerolineales bacterium]